MRISSADLLGTASIAANQAVRAIDQARDNSPDPVERLTYAEEKLVAALAEIRAARWGVTRFMPQFDDVDLDIVLATEYEALLGTHGVIPAHS